MLKRLRARGLILDRLDRGIRSVIVIACGFAGTWLLAAVADIDVRSATGEWALDFAIWVLVALGFGLVIGECVASAYSAWTRWSGR